MKTYLIGYDLLSAGQNYSELTDKIKGLSNQWWHHLESTWIIKSDSTAKSIRDSLSPFIDSNDEILVVRLSGEGAWTGFNNDGSKWLRNNLSGA